MKNKSVLLNVPVILTFRDYHEIGYVEDYFNELISNKKIKSKEITVCGEEYAAIFYFTQDEDYKRLIKEYKRLNKEEY